MTPERSTLNRIMLWAFCGWLVVVPLPFGSARTWALSLVLPVLFTLAIGITLTVSSTRDGLPAFLCKRPGAFLAGFLAILCLQLVPLGGGTISVAPYRTSLYLLLALSCAVVIWMTLVLVRSDRDLNTLMLAILAGGLLQAVLATVFIANGGGPSLLDSEIVAQAGVTGTFVNRNHLAGYLNISLSVGCGLMIGRLAHTRGGDGPRPRLRDALEMILGAKARLRLLLVMLVIVLIGTRSRMGNAAFFAALTVATCCYAAFSRSRRRSLLLFAGSIVVVDVLLVGAWVGFDRVVERLGNTPLIDQRVHSSPDHPDSTADAGIPLPDPRLQQSVEERIEPAIYTLSIVRDHPWLGTGGGTFYLAYMAYRPDGNWFWSHAHNDYLEIAADTGLLGLALLLALAAHSGWSALRLLKRARNPVHRAAAFATVMSLTAMGLHATVDFNLHIPANLFTFCVVLALPWAAWRLRQRNRPPQHPTTIRSAGSRPAGSA